ncbi:lysozyme [Rufibacter ruber]|uniref:lysozyme n=1 Tax=Rufibacter ruber TaxID=1783499 RepID=UPI000831BCDC|nr:lysozyme [Rufibacter ruber]
MKISKNGIELIKRFEGLRLKAYLCSAKVATIGYGTTKYPNGKAVKLGDTCTLEEAEAYLKNDLKVFEFFVGKCLTRAVNQNQYDALVSFAYNCGAEALRKSTLLKKVNNDPSDATIAGEFQKWVNAGGVKVKGLVTRRTTEANLYFA